MELLEGLVYWMAGSWHQLPPLPSAGCQSVMRPLLHAEEVGKVGCRPRRKKIDLVDKVFCCLKTIFFYKGSRQSIYLVFNQEKLFAPEARGKQAVLILRSCHSVFNGQFTGTFKSKFQTKGLKIWLQCELELHYISSKACFSYHDVSCLPTI